MAEVENVDAGPDLPVVPETARAQHENANRAGSIETSSYEHKQRSQKHHRRGHRASMSGGDNEPFCSSRPYISIVLLEPARFFAEATATIQCSTVKSTLEQGKYCNGNERDAEKYVGLHAGLPYLATRASFQQSSLSEEDSAGVSELERQSINQYVNQCVH